MVSIMLVVGACGTSDDRSGESEPERTAGGLQERGDTHQAALDIRAGYGIPNCYVGMPISELGEGWKQVEGVTDGKYLSKSDAGIEVMAKDHRIFAIFFKFKGAEVGPFSGKTSKGISSVSGLDDIRLRYGDQSYISESQVSEYGEFPGKLETSVWYVEAGIGFTLIDGKVATIVVKPPLTQFDYGSLRETFGNSLIYVRPEAD